MDYSIFILSVKNNPSNYQKKYPISFQFETFSGNSNSQCFQSFNILSEGSIYDAMTVFNV